MGSEVEVVGSCEISIAGGSPCVGDAIFGASGEHSVASSTRCISVLDFT